MADKANPRAGGANGPGTARFLLRSFKRILECNTGALERMARMDRAMGGEYVFDKAFLHSAAREVCALTHRSVYHLNGMSNEGHVGLYDVFLQVKDTVGEVLSGGMGPLAKRAVLAFSEIGWELEPLVGLCSAGLAVLGMRMGLPAPDGVAVTVTGVGELLRGGRDDVLARVAGAVGELFARLGGPRRLELSLVQAGEGGTGEVLAAAFADTPEAAAEAVLVLAFANMLPPDAAAQAGPSGARGEDGEQPRALAHLAVCIRPTPEAVVEGWVQTVAFDPDLPSALVVTARDAREPGPADRFWLSRTAPHRPLRSRVAAKPAHAALSGGRPLDAAPGGRLRGSAWLDPEQAAQAAGLGLAAERALGGACVLRFALTRRGRLRITGLEPVTDPYPEWAEAHDDPQIREGDSDEPVLRGGRIACGGVGCGPVVRLDESTPVESVPLGSVGVARAALPSLSRVTPRLGALLTEVGTAASHLGTVARENHVPAIFGLKGAAGLEEGSVVTVDADQGAVYAGVAEPLLRQAALQGAKSRTEPEYLVLGRLLRHLRPLNLTDPQSGNFTPENCRTCHDILHYAHETAIGLLLSMGGKSVVGLGSPRLLRADSPLELGIIDLGGGLAAPAGPVTPDEVTSRPLRAFLSGLLCPKARRGDPAGLSLGDIVGGMGRTAKALSADPASAGLNLAIVAEDYANITLRLGYHFSVVDAAVSPRAERNFVYFRFVGGFADDARRARRAAMVLDVLDRLDFKAARRGDLVVGRRTQVEAQDARETLRVLGALTAFTRQLDVDLVSQDQVARRVSEFLRACGPNDSAARREA